jgi:hypothetical protein
LVKRAVLPIASNAVAFAEGYSGDPRTVITGMLKLVAGRLQEPRLIAIPRLMLREMINFPDLAQMYRREVLDRVLPVLTGLLKSGIRDGYFRPVDPELTIRSIVGPLVLHLLMATVFDLVPADGLAIDRLIDNHLTILFDGLSAPVSDKRFMSS